RLLKRWEEDGTLVRDPLPAFYPYQQTSRGPDGEVVVRLGFLGALALPGEEDESGGKILLHEKTLEGPRKDRTRLIRACQANLSPIFLLHPDSTGGAEAALKEGTEGKSLFTFEDGAGVLHELWRVDDADLVARLQSALAPDWTLIADGHHRYES